MRKKWKVFFNHIDCKYDLLAFFLPLCCQLIAYAIGGYFPFGDKTVLVWDMDIQYISFFSWMNQVMKRQSIDSLFYSFSLSFGGSTAGLLGYYLLSPFNLLLIPFSTKWLPVGVQIISILKICCCGLTMYHYLSKRFQMACYGTVLFSTMYALMGYTVTQQSNLMWLDGVILMPILLINVYALIKGQRRLQYPLWIAAAVITDFYIAYMVLLFSFVYFLLEWVILKKEWNWKEFLKASSVLIGYMLLGIGLSSVVLLPVLYEIFSIGRGGARGVAASISLLFQMKKDLFMLPLKCLIGAYDEQQLVCGLPNIYVSLCCFPFFMIFFMDKRNTRQGRMCHAAVILFLLLSFSSIGLNQIWHGFTYTSGSNYRYSFCMSFLIITIGYQQYLQIVRTGKICRLSKGGLLCILLIAFWGMKAAYTQFKMDIFAFSSIHKWMLSFLIGIAACLFVFIIKWGKQEKQPVFYLIFTFVMGMELVINMDWSMEAFSYRSLTEHQNYAEMLGNTYRQLAEENSGKFFRMENELREPLNDAMLIGYPSITHYSSTVRNEVAEYAIAHNLQPEGYGRQATFFEIGRVDAKEAGELAIKYLLIPALPEEMNGWEVKKDAPFYLLENRLFKPLCYLQEENGTVSIDMKNSAKMKVHVSDAGANGNELMTSIPDRDGWRIKVDGQRYLPQNEDLMIQVKLLPGSHEIELEFRQPMLVIGMTLSLLSFIILSMLVLAAHRRKLP